jgi:hypothetical protein
MESICDSCQESLCGCKTKEEDKERVDNMVIKCKDYFPRHKAGVCIACDSGGRL